MADNSSLIALSASLTCYVGNLRGKLGEVPTEADMVDTRGEATGPAYQYHEALTQLGQSVSKQSSEFLNVLHSIQSWMAESIEELSQTDEEAIRAGRCHAPWVALKVPLLTGARKSGWHQCV